MAQLAYVGLGGNVGDVRATLRAAVEELRGLAGVAGVRVASLWQTEPLGEVQDQPWFLNTVAELALEASGAPAPGALLAALLAIEARHGRDRGHELHAGPRRLDLDLLLYGTAVLDEPGPPPLIVPHPRLHARAFALAPLVELAGRTLVIPGPSGGDAGQLLDRAIADPHQQLRRVGSLA